MNEGKVMLESTPVAAYAIGDHKEMTPGAIRNWRYTEDLELAMAAVDEGRSVKFVKMYRLHDGRLVKDPWVPLASPYTGPEPQPEAGCCEAPTATEAEILKAHGCDVDSIAVHAALRKLPPPASAGVNYGKSWTEDERTALALWWAYQKKTRAYPVDADCITKIAKRFGRSTLAIRCKLEALGFRLE